MGQKPKRLNPSTGLTLPVDGPVDWSVDGFSKNAENQLFSSHEVSKLFRDHPECHETISYPPIDFGRIVYEPNNGLSILFSYVLSATMKGP